MLLDWRIQIPLRSPMIHSSRRIPRHDVSRAFFKGDERKGKAFENWAGALESS
jgi:hypothetical protein